MGFLLSFSFILLFNGCGSVRSGGGDGILDFWVMISVNDIVIVKLHLPELDLEPRIHGKGSDKGDDVNPKATVLFRTLQTHKDPRRRRNHIVDSYGNS